MNKKQAREEALNNTRSIRQLRELINQQRGKGGQSRVNKQFPKESALDIFHNAMAGRKEDEIPKGFQFDIYKERDVISKDGLLIQNILRECT